jgi:hypothetical protein
MNTLRLAEETYIDEVKMVRQTPKKTEQAWSQLGTLSLLTMIKVLKSLKQPNTANMHTADC